MTRLMPEDWQVAAYEAAIREDRESVVASVVELGTYGREAVGRAMHAWMDRTQVAMVTLAKKVSQPVEFAVQAEADPVTGAMQLDPEVAWAGALFAAHVRHDHDDWNSLFDAVTNQEELTSGAVTLLRVLATAATTIDQSYAEAATEPDTTITRQDVPPGRQAAMLARAHLD